MKRLDGMRVLVTGAARGIGAETGRQLARLGACVALVGLEPERLAALAAELGAGHVWAECDVTDYAAVEAAVQDVTARLRGLDAVIANAGIANNSTVAANPARAVAKTIEVNLIGVVHTVSATLPALTESRGYYLLVSSAAAFTALPGMAAYCASKAGVEHFADALRLEVAHRDIEVGIAFPSWIDTDLIRDQQTDLTSFNQMLKPLPWPFNTVTSVEKCAEAYVKAIAERRERIYIPESIRPVSFGRQLLLGPAWQAIFKRRARTSVPLLEREASRLGRAFGSHSMGLVLTERERQPKS